ncbi:MAG: hypothetical protein H7Y59_06545 [Anaerolineales bacterium]|nr:hypothetical protein [Anaerolineales bacterium]
MKIIIKLTLAAGALLSSCNLPAASSPDPQIATAAALTVQAAINTSENATPLVTSIATNSVGVTSTPTFSQPMASVGEVTNCRAGPGTNYARITQLVPNESVEIIGFFSPNYWIVFTKLGECWLSGEFATPVGSFASVPTVTAPPTQEDGALDAATFPNNGWTFFCYGPGQADITLTWNDKADNETGYRILRNNEVILELPANSTNFSETLELDSGQSVGYIVRAYNLAGEADSAPVTITCP